MKVLLIHPPTREWAKPNVFPSGLGYLAAIARNEGFDIEVLDINAHRYSPEEVEEIIAKSDADVFGIGGIITVYGYIKKTIEIIKKYHPTKIVIGGGSSATSIPKTFLERTKADIAVIGEGEATFPELLHVLENGDDLSGVQGIWYKSKSGDIQINLPRPGIKNLDDIPFPAWDLFPMEIYLKNPVGRTQY